MIVRGELFPSSQNYRVDKVEFAARALLLRSASRAHAAALRSCSSSCSPQRSLCAGCTTMDRGRGSGPAKAIERWQNSGSEG